MGNFLPCDPRRHLVNDSKGRDVSDDVGHVSNDDGKTENIFDATLDQSHEVHSLSKLFSMRSSATSFQCFGDGSMSCASMLCSQQV